MKICELCKNPARTRCQPEEVNLCWDCDARVHSANFLAARHLRILLCNVCQSPSPWKASGAKLGPTVSVCAGCAGYEAAVGESGSNIRSGSNNRYEITRGDDESDVDEWDDEEGEEEDDEDDDVVDAFGVDDTEDGDNQVVPRSSSPPPPPATSSSSSEESSSRFSNTDSNVFESTSPTLACKADERRKPMRMLKNAASPRSDVCTLVHFYSFLKTDRSNGFWIFTIVIYLTICFIATFAGTSRLFVFSPRPRLYRNTNSGWSDLR